MNKPEKKEIEHYDHECDMCCCGCIQDGVNRTIEYYEAHLPSEEEIFDIMSHSNIPQNGKGHTEWYVSDTYKMFAKAIYNRIYRGKK